MLVHHRVTPSSMSPVPIYIPGFLLNNTAMNKPTYPRTANPPVTYTELYKIIKAWSNSILLLRINHESKQTICGLAWNPKGNKEFAYTDNQVGMCVYSSLNQKFLPWIGTCNTGVHSVLNLWMIVILTNNFPCTSVIFCDTD